MKIAHFDCFSGISGDMTLAALIDAGVPADAIRAALDSLQLPIQVKIEKVRKGGFAATTVQIEAPHEHKHRHLHHVEDIIAKGTLTDRQRDLALKIFRRLAEAEAAVHGIEVKKVHFHEVGALDSIADIVGAAVGLDLLEVDQFVSGPVAVGGGMVQCEHGMMPVPAPATAQLLRGVPLRSTKIEAELTTPTGAAILTAVVESWLEAPTLTIDRIGLGAGRRDLKEQPNVLRLFVGASTKPVLKADVAADQVWMLETNLDDVPAEILGYTQERLFAAGALDVFTVPIFMKKNRPGVLLSAMAGARELDALEEILFAETATFGIRRYAVERHKLHRQETTAETPWGVVGGKLGWVEGRPAIFTPEYEDCARIARECGVPLREVYQAALRSTSK